MFYLWLRYDHRDPDAHDGQNGIEIETPSRINLCTDIVVGFTPMCESILINFLLKICGFSSATVHICMSIFTLPRRRRSRRWKKNWQTHWMPFFISYKFFSKLLQYWLVYFACNVRDSLQFQRIRSLFALKSHRANNHTHRHWHSHKHILCKRSFSF